MYIGKDKSPKQEKVEALTKRLAAILKETVPQADVFAHKPEGVITIDFQPIISLLVPNKIQVDLLWNMEVLQKYGGINKEAIVQRFNATSRGAANIQWQKCHD